jgi:hypothetical protein
MSFYRDEPKILEAFKTGKGVAWGEHDKDLYQGTERIQNFMDLIIILHL